MEKDSLERNKDIMISQIDNMLITLESIKGEIDKRRYNIVRSGVATLRDSIDALESQYESIFGQ